ncbi:hypothetical protein K469DRAFT_666265 [Zopfia rhizophila CBS 207.26]|uniref:Uncharacterized protein n=1 Tax=Zopfia rhizophila CBS 207.26 TaxID=1314779 RepID=A0A6A6E2Z7_9PEZI|nr:hypothetical protein K469DRAFT_666265 [Zopfia rhizophila CBS 207.26]
MPADTENILSMERFDGMLKSVECNTDNLALTFEDDATFKYAQKVWDWVNGEDNHSFVMVAGVGDCGNNTRRMPFIVSSIKYDEEANRATLAANSSDWKAIAHSYDLVVGQVTQAPETGSKVRPRDITKTTSIDMKHDFPFSVGISANGLSANLACSNCSSTGQFDMEFRISQKLFVPTGASMKVSPKGVSAIAQVKLSGSGSVTDSLTKTFDILKVPISGITIPGVLDLGPFLTVAVGAELSGISVTAGVTGGATAKLDDKAVLEVDLLDPKSNKFSGWEPSIDPLDVKVDASISGGVAVFLQPSLELKAEALGKCLGQGFEIGLNMKVPNINAKLAAVASPQGACPDTPGQPKKTLGVNVSANIGAQLNIAASKSGSSDPLFTVQLATIDKPLASKCFPFGPQVAARSIDKPLEHRHRLRISDA